MTIKCAYVDVSGGQVHYRYAERDATGTPIVYFHQTASSSKMWIKVMDMLGGIGPHYAFDTPGFGGSFDPEGDPAMGDYVDWLAQAVKSVAGEKVHIVGHHTGACIGCEMASRYPDLAETVTLIGPVPLTAEERLEFSKVFGTPFTPTVSGGYLMDNWHYLYNLGAHHDVDLYHREMWDMMRAWQGRVKSYGAVWDQDFTEHYKAITAPLLIMCAQDDVLWPFFDRAKEIRPDATAIVPKGANFEPDLDPETVASAIRQHVS